MSCPAGRSRFGTATFVLSPSAISVFAGISQYSSGWSLRARRLGSASSNVATMIVTPMPEPQSARLRGDRSGWVLPVVRRSAPTAVRRTARVQATAVGSSGNSVVSAATGSTTP